MLSSQNMMGFVICTDYDKARAFYESKLGFTFVSLDQFALVMLAGKSTIRISKLADFKPAQHTVLGWNVADIEAMVAWLSDRGVAFEKYPFIQDKVRWIWTTPDGNKVAWFKDLDGNVLGISQHL